jgi:CDP-diacylglycerol--glycerol-3-phosphate 3-phosphatidyltransferase/cardiolipin synthase
MTANAVTTLRLLLLVPLGALLLCGTDAASRWEALGVFLAAGLSDILDGFLARRLGQASAFGAVLDLVADRLLTAVTVIALIAAGTLRGWAVAPAVVLILRDLIVASLNEALPGLLAIRVSALERFKIAAQFTALALLIAPDVRRPELRLSLHDAGVILLGIAALLALVTVADYWRRALREFAAARQGGPAEIP